MKPKGDVVDLVERRTLLKGLAAGLAGAVAAPGSAAADAAEVTASASAAGAQGQASSAAASPRFLDDHARRTLGRLAESLVPGSVAAGVIDLIDRVATVDSPSRQRRLLNALGRFDQEARTAHGARWIDLDEGVRIEILRQASTAPESQPQPPAWVKGQPLVFESTLPPGPATLRDHFEYLRASVANAYYTTEPGMRELGWTGQTAWRELPGCTHPGPEHE